MSIRLLPPQLANQIAAGEVVERPASVIKELVENALDAGATEIVIEVEKGGSKLIRVRDNGCGVAQDELTLALSRHATSKIHDFSDLANIVSLGFRGEALASISSVSRLTLTSKPASQDNAWQAQAEGREMAVQVRPAAHPVGTTVEVLDLFFNTPARRRFLKSDKTEFSHIDELVKRLALSRFDVSWTLVHNGQPVRQLRAATDDAARQKRLAALCGKAFAQQALQIQSEYEQIRLHGWLLPALACHSQLVCQYSYVNGRMMRDKLLGHAIRQAYAADLPPESQPAYVLYLEIPSEEVDVNVHPAKHEVRFHQARLVHDYVASALADALAQVQSDWLTARAEPVTKQPTLAKPVASAKPAVSAQSAALAAPAPQWAVGVAAQQSSWQGLSARVDAPYRQHHSPGSPQDGRPNAHQYNQAAYPQRITSADRAQGAPLWPLQQVAEPAAGCDHRTELGPDNSESSSTTMSQTATTVEAKMSLPAHAAGFWRLSSTTLLAMWQQQCWLVDAPRSLANTYQQHTPANQALLLPVRLSLSGAEITMLTTHAEQLAAMGFDFLLSNSTLIIRAVPTILATLPLANVLTRWWEQWQANGVGWQELFVLLLAEPAAQPALNRALEALYLQPELWLAVPLDWSFSQRQLEELSCKTTA